MKICSGLESFGVCEKRDQCANYVHWLDDPRSEINVCTTTGQAFKYYVPRNIPIAATAAAQGQGSLF